MKVPRRKSTENGEGASLVLSCLELLVVSMVPVFGKKKKPQVEEEEEKVVEKGPAGVSPEKLEQDFSRPTEMPVIQMPTDAPPIPTSDSEIKSIPHLASPPDLSPALAPGTWLCPECDTTVDDKTLFCTYCGYPKPETEPATQGSSGPPVPEYETPLSIMKDYSDAVDDKSSAAPSPFPKKPKPGAAKPRASKAQKAPVSEVQKAPVSEVQKAPMSEIQKAPMSEVQKAPVRKVQKAPVKKVHKAPVKKVVKAPVRKVIKASARWKCPKCKSVLDSQYKFCTNCGYKRG